MWAGLRGTVPAKGVSKTDIGRPGRPLLGRLFAVVAAIAWGAPITIAAPAPLAPLLGAPHLSQVVPVLACAPGGPPLGASAAEGLVLALSADAEPGVLVQFTRDPVAPGPWRAVQARPRLRAWPGEVAWVRTLGAAGIVGEWIPLAVPEPEIMAAVASRFPFTAGLACPQQAPRARVRTVRALWPGRPRPHRTRLRPPGSALTWTWYRRQGLSLNWVHAATELNDRLGRRQMEDFRAGVAEALAGSVRQTATGGRAFRLNENHFAVPEDGHRPPWRDAMGTAAILALLPAALAPDAPPVEREAARGAAAEYLETFSVDWRRGGVLWRDGGPGSWYLEYAHRPRRRVLNGFMQAVVSLDRFRRQAERLAARDRGWRPLADRAGTRVREGTRAVARWLPAYDLGPGATRYALGGGRASEEYRRYHRELLGRLARMALLPPAWRARYRHYQARWASWAERLEGR